VATRIPIEGDEARHRPRFTTTWSCHDPHFFVCRTPSSSVYRADDGELVAEDVGTLNGFSPEAGAHRLKQLSLAKEPGFRIGAHDSSRRDARHPVAPGEIAYGPPRAHEKWSYSWAQC